MPQVALAARGSSPLRNSLLKIDPSPRRTPGSRERASSESMLYRMPAFAGMTESWPLRDSDQTACIPILALCRPRGDRNADSNPHSEFRNPRSPEVLIVERAKPRSDLESERQCKT
jgi:hypothetical protein